MSGWNEGPSGPEEGVLKMSTQVHARRGRAGSALVLTGVLLLAVASIMVIGQGPAGASHDGNPATVSAPTEACIVVVGQAHQPGGVLHEDIVVQGITLTVNIDYNQTNTQFDWQVLSPSGASVSGVFFAGGNWYAWGPGTSGTTPGPILNHGGQTQAISQFAICGATAPEGPPPELIDYCLDGALFTDQEPPAPQGATEPSSEGVGDERCAEEQAPDPIDYCFNGQVFLNQQPPAPPGATTLVNGACPTQTTTPTTTPTEVTTTTVAGPDEPDEPAEQEDTTTTTLVAGPDDPELPMTGSEHILAILAGSLGLVLMGSGSLVIAADRRRFMA
jgi:hypothetical protein